MIVLDANVISEMMNTGPHAGVRAWMTQLNPADVWSTTIVEAEIFREVKLLPDGRRKLALEKMARTVFDDILGGRVLPFDRTCVETYARIFAQRSAAGRPMTGFDGLIAACALGSDAALATRNTSDFEGLGLTLINPWEFIS